MYHPRLKGIHYEMGKHYGDNYVVAPNHFITDEMVKYNSLEENWYHTDNRFHSIDNCLRSFETMDFKRCKEIISGKYGFVCQFEKSLHFDTIWSAVYNLKSLYNEICEGNPSKMGFKYDNRLDWGMKKNTTK